MIAVVCGSCDGLVDLAASLEAISCTGVVMTVASAVKVVDG